MAGNARRVPPGPARVPRPGGISRGHDPRQYPTRPQEQVPAPLSGYLKYWDVYGRESYTEYLAALSEERQVLFFEFSLTSGDPDNHWRAILDPSTLRVLAAERWIKRST